MKIIHVADGNVHVNTAFMKQKAQDAPKLTGD